VRERGEVSKVSLLDEVQKAIDEAREDGCPLCPNPEPTDRLILRVVAVHAECMEKPDPEDDEDEEESVN
jgi:hypothetical protein